MEWYGFKVKSLRGLLFYAMMLSLFVVGGWFMRWCGLKVAPLLLTMERSKLIMVLSVICSVFPGKPVRMFTEDCEVQSSVFLLAGFSDSLYVSEVKYKGFNWKT